MGEHSGKAGTLDCAGGRVCPLSPAQEGMFFQTMARPGSGCYVEQVVLRFREALDVDRIVACWQAAVDRHVILRTTFLCEESPEPGQFVHGRVTLPCLVEDWRGLTAEDQDRALSTYLAEDRARGFDLGEAPLMRVAIFQMGDGDFMLNWTVHHLVVDGRSMNLLLREIFADYDTGRIAELESPSFGEYATWLQDEPPEAANAYWRSRLEGVYEATALPLSAPRAGTATTRAIAQLRHQLDRARSAAIAAFAETQGLTVNIVLLGAWALVAHRYSDAADVLLGATKAVRHGPAASPDGIGPYINTLPIRTTLEGSTPVVAWLRALREQWIALREVEHSPTDRIRACGEIPGDAPLFNLYYVFERETLGDSLRALGGRWADREVSLYEHTPVPLILAGYGGESLLLSIEYDPQCFVQSDMDRLMGHLIQMLDSIVDSPEVPASQLALLPPRELDALLRDAQPETVSPVAAMTPGLFEAVVSRCPAATALRFKDTSMTYGELNRRANQLARHLRGLGVDAEVRVAVSLPRSAEAIIALLAILKAGGAYVPMDPAYPVARLAYTLEDSGAAVLITDEATRVRLGESAAKVVLMGGGPSTLDRYSGENLSLLIAPPDLAYIIYTSGSTGKPKGVSVAHGEAAQHFSAMIDVYRLRPGDTTLQFASLSFDVSLEQIFSPLLAGSVLHIADDSMYAAPDFSAVLREADITVLNLPPAFWQQWTDEGIARGLADFGAQFRLLIVGGDVVLPRTVRQWQAHPATQGVTLMNAYGPTETVITALHYVVPPDFDSEETRDRLPIGRPIRGTECIVLDRFQNPVPPGLPGELYIGGNRLARGYHNRPELTAQVFVAHPLRPASGGLLYRTGDRVRQLADGTFEFLGRFDDQVKIRGFRIELREIEAALLRCVGLRAVAVRRVLDRGGEAQLAAYVVPEQGVSVDAGNLRAELRASLPDYMVPAGFVVLDAFPVTVNGKIDYRALPALDEQSLAPHREFVAPGTRTQRILADLWREILGCGQVGTEDSFFDLGGHSLRAARLVTRIRSEFGVQVALGDFLLHPTIRELARRIDGDDASIHPDEGETAEQADPCIVTLQAAGDKPPLFCILGAGGARSAYGPLAAHLGGEQPILALQYSHLADYRKFSTVEYIAERYLAALRSRQPEGPYYLAGWSFGGLVSYEMARALRAQGDTVALLAIIDCEARVPVSASLRGAAAGIHRQMLRVANRVRIIYHTRETLLLHARDIATLLIGRHRDGTSLKEYLQFVRSSLVNAYAMKQAGLQPAETRLSRLDLVADDFVRKVVAGLQANERASEAYHMEPYEGAVTLFRTREMPSGFGNSDATLGYRQVAAKVDVVVVEGNHFTLVKEPCVRQLAERLGEALRASRDAAK